MGVWDHPSPTQGQRKPAELQYHNQMANLAPPVYPLVSCIISSSRKPTPLMIDLFLPLIEPWTTDSNPCYGGMKLHIILHEEKILPACPTLIT